MEQQSKLDRRERLLDAAAELLDSGGYDALTARAIAARGNVSVGLLYHYFGDKHDVFGALLQREQATLTALLDGAPRESLPELLRHVVPATTEQWRRIGRMTAAWAADRPPAPPETMSA
ncbi:MAG TPA: helix-turn-helix domain-containing protein, partial [Ilumatobacteraceae bacterium]|nr:helix-turn-helix domain-containing protein [Ilumatobacteraceae bacterium]